MITQKLAQRVEIVHDAEVILHTAVVAPELVEHLSANNDLVMQSKARWEVGGKALYGQKVVDTGPFEFVERKVGGRPAPPARGPSAQRVSSARTRPRR